MIDDRYYTIVDVINQKLWWYKDFELEYIRSLFHGNEFKINLINSPRITNELTSSQLNEINKLRGRNEVLTQYAFELEEEYKKQNVKNRIKDFQELFCEYLRNVKHYLKSQPYNPDKKSVLLDTEKIWDFICIYKNES